MITDIEKNQVKDVYENISNHFSNTRVYKWTWVNDFLESLKENNLVRSEERRVGKEC